MQKTILTILAIIAIIGGIAVSMYMMSKTSEKRESEEKSKIEISDKISDECEKEYDELQKEQIEEANTEEVEKLSPNARIIFEKYYNDCEHIIKNSEQIPNSLVNATKEEVKSKYASWELKDFSKEKIVLYQEVDGECNEHYMLRDVDGKINIYKLDENGNEALLNETDIATEYLTSTDMINIENGLIVYGRDSLNKLLEDFE